MKPICLLTSTLIILVLTSIKSPVAADPLTPGKVLAQVVCREAPNESYALYIPAKGNKLPLPIIYIFDAHGAGALPVNKYKSLADTYGFILAGSNNSKNGNDFATAEKIWQHILNDTRTRLNIDTRQIYTAGFSGGAKVASYVAISYPLVKGVIANGAGLPDGIAPGNFSFSLTILTGEGDMNMTDLVSYSKELDKTNTRHRLLLFNGKHEWAPASTMEQAFAGLRFDAIRSGLIPEKTTQTIQYIASSKNRIATREKANDLVSAERECTFSIHVLEGLTPEVAWFKTKAHSISSKPTYQKQRQFQTNLLMQEQNAKEAYAQHFQEGDAYWQNAIRTLKDKATAKTPEQAMYQRLLAYLSLAFYSLSNRYLSANENTGARHFVELYKLADPTNSEAWYLSAELDAREGKGTKAEADLLKAVKSGFRDISRLRQETSFQHLSPKVDIQKVERSMKTN